MAFEAAGKVEHKVGEATTVMEVLLWWQKEPWGFRHLHFAQEDAGQQQLKSENPENFKIKLPLFMYS